MIQAPGDGKSSFLILTTSKARRRALGHERSIGSLCCYEHQEAGTLEEHPNMTKQTIAVEHFHIESARSFVDVSAEHGRGD